MDKQKTPTFDSQLFGMTTIIECGINNAIKSQGSGFFYNKISPVDPNIKGGQWRKIEGIWLITNRHVALLKINDKENLPDYLTFNLREIINEQVVEWLPITLSKDEIIKRLKLHPNPSVDIVAIDINDLATDIQIKNPNRKIILPFSLSNDNLPNVSPLQIEVTNDIVVASYPRGFYDSINKFPIVKSGIVASAWNSSFNGLPLFLIDAKLFPGSSGGLVISKPTNFAMIDGKPMHSLSKQFVLLGVYSGEPIYQSNPIDLDGLTVIKKESYGLGNVWYSYLIPEIIDNGVMIQTKN
jgi:hypothetical protein